MYILLLAACMSCSLYAEKKRVMIDQVAVTIHGPSHTTYLCSSDLARPSLEGQLLSPDKAVYQELVCQDMERFKMTNGDEGNKHIERMKKENNYTDNDIKAMFEQTGRSMHEGIQEVTHLQQYHGMEQMQTYAHVFVSEQEIKDYYDNNPLYTEGDYTFCVASIGYQDDTSAQAEHILHTINNNPNQLPWSTPVTIQEHELSDEHKTILQSINQQSIAGPFARSKGYELIKLVKKSSSELIPLKQRYKTIKASLEQEQANNFLADYQKSLRKDAIVTYHTQSPQGVKS